jgi:hypothetical protein
MRYLRLLEICPHSLGAKHSKSSSGSVTRWAVEIDSCQSLLFAYLVVLIPLFAEVPSLPQKHLKVAERQPIAHQARTFFDYLFARSSRPTVGAHYNIVDYRLRDMDEIDSALRAAACALRYRGFEQSRAVVIKSDRHRNSELRGRSLLEISRYYCRYRWMRVARSPGSPCRSIEDCHERNSSNVSM